MTEPSDWTYVVTDIEVDGPWAGANSMRSFASVATTTDGRTFGEFEAVLEPLPGAAPNPRTKEWFDSEPGTWEAATADPQPVAQVMAGYVEWVRSLPGPRAFAAAPVSFDGTWIDYYLRRFTPYGLHQGPYEEDRLFHGPALCLRTYTAALTGRPPADLASPKLPPHWLGDVPHTHKAIDDVRGFAHLLHFLTRTTGTPTLRLEA
ncbi:hypothetical protein ACFC1T_32025 [Kitasatospora sp. NPDC056076]|uniref:hypothetical protein n=1 Tax=Kitasatospora sp. NPDC056076 TaxID=3345703 RepID=UPI0035E37D0C